MGAGSSINVNQFSEGCDLDKIVSKVKGLKANSASPTDTWILDFKSNVYYDNVRLEKGFMKYFVDPYSLEPTNQSVNLIYHLLGLRYEISVYRDVIKPLIDYQVCPNFISFLFAGISCKGITLLNSLKTTLPEVEASNNLERNIEYITNNVKQRPSITERSNKLSMLNKKIHKNVDRSWKYSFMVNKVINPDTTTTFFDFITTKGSKLDYYQKAFVLFDILYACYAMNCAGVIHNDLHLGNIYLETLPTPVKVCYIYGDDKKKFVFERNYKIMVYDFDRAYAQVLGENKLLNIYCKDFASCNRLSSNKDFYKVIQSMYVTSTSKRDRELCLNLLTSDKRKMAQLEEYFKDQQGNIYIFKGMPLNDSVFARYNSGEIILDTLVNQLKAHYKVNFDGSDFTEKYVCRPSLFKNGKLLLSKDSKKAEESEKLFQELYEKCSELKVRYISLEQQLEVMKQRENQQLGYNQEENNMLKEQIRRLNQENQDLKQEIIDREVMMLEPMDVDNNPF